jgi:two-component system, sensor histidine kinase and response regulator
LRNYYILETAFDGQDALDVMPKFRPDLVLLDIDMPGMDGYETCLRIRAEENFKLIKVLLVSGHANLDERLRGYEVGADDYVAKPFDNNELRAKVNVFARLKRVEEIDSIKSNLLSLFSHETRTPLASIMGIAELMTFDETLSEDARNRISLIYKSSIDLYRFVEKAALLSNLKNGMSLQCIDGSVRQHLVSIAQGRDFYAREKDIDMIVDCPADINVSADWNTLDEVLGYLLDNAVKFSKKGSSITARAEADANICTIEIADQGDGIDPSWIDTIFDEFAVRDLMHHQKGQGLSLAIAKQVVELHSGEIYVESTPGEGATFTVRLPLQEPEEQTQVITD